MSACGAEGLGVRGQRGGWTYPPELAREAATKAPTGPHLHRLSSPPDLEDVPSAQLEGSQMKPREGEKIIKVIMEGILNAV